MLPDIRNNTAFFESSHTSTACPSDTSSIKMKKSTADWWTESDGRKPKHSNRTCPSATFSITNPHGQARESNHASAVTNRPNHGAAKASPATRSEQHCSDGLRERQPRLTVRSRFANRAQQTENPRHSFRARLHSTTLAPGGVRPSKVRQTHR